MKVLDYARSTITFAIAGVNQARIAIESSCRLEIPGREPLDIWLVASCKAEQCYGPGPIFRDPNYDFSMLYSRERYCIRRIGATYQGEAHESGFLAERFAGVRFDLLESKADRLSSGVEIVAAALAARRIVARNVIRDPDSGATATIEYPVKTLNIHPEESRFQTDTGPVAIPSDAGWGGDPAAFDLAFGAFNDFERVEWIRQRPLSVADGVAVQHYHAVEAMPAQNSLWAVLE